MRLPIAYCLGLPVRLPHGYGTIDFTQNVELTFEAPDPKAFPALGLAYEAARLGGAAPAWLSAANEVAVAAFLDDQISWCEIIDVVSHVMDNYFPDPLHSLDELIANDAQARREAHSILK
jgi:1-deoxy-D-xylulose-5-phosphate reductoisomerase